jgi:hypothetical protein
MRHVHGTVRAAAVIGALAFFALASPVAAENCDKGNQMFKPKCEDQIGPPLAATPELGSLVLFGSGLAGVAGYALTRYRARARSK